MEDNQTENIVDLDTLSVTDLLRAIAAQMHNVTPERADGVKVYADTESVILVLNLRNVGGSTSQGASIKVGSLGGNLNLRKAGIASAVELGFNAWRPAKTAEEFQMLIDRQATAQEAAEVKKSVEAELAARRRASVRP